MKIDFATLAFGYTVKVGGGTPNWATALGQGQGYKINNNAEINELLKGLVYSSVSLSKVSTKIGKGGRCVSGNVDDSPIIVASVFNKVYINDTHIMDGKYVLLITRDTSKSHFGRLRVKYGPSNTYQENGASYSNEQFWEKAKAQLNLEENACFFVYDISVQNQDELILRTIIIDSLGAKEYADSKALHAAWDYLIEEDEKNNGKMSHESIESEYEPNGVISPEWFEEKAVAFPNLDSDANEFLAQFNMTFSPDKLEKLSGAEILDFIFLNPNNKSNLCYVLEFDSNCRMIFGSIKSGSAYKYGLHYSKKNKSWAIGTNAHPEFVSEEEAIILGTQIRDNLLAGVELIKEAGEIKSLEDYRMLYRDLDDITDGYINRMWFLKYYTLVFPDIFPTIYSANAQNTVLERIGIKPEDNPVARMGQIKEYIEKCNISNVMFGKIFWTYCIGDCGYSAETQEDGMDLRNCLDVIREPIQNKTHPLNLIVYGAPGTGKTYSMVEYALSIIDNVPFADFIRTHKNRKDNMARYRELAKSGQIVFVTFHQSYGYEEFIQGLRPDTDSETMSFKTVDGVFKTIADLALNDTDGKRYVIIIDEINRANISKVFGELITLIEEDKRWGEVNETYATLQSGDIFAVPNNLYIIGTMNSADKSISLIDAALRRRFSFIEQKPNDGLVSDPLLRKTLHEMNLILVKELDSTDLLVGHSYFMNKTSSDLCDILNNNIIPLLYEYFYDNRKKVAGILNEVITKSGAQIEIEDNVIGRLRVKTKDDSDDSEQI